MLNPDKPQKVPYLTSVLGDSGDPVISSTDYIKVYADQVREFIPATFMTLGTDGFGRSDTREKLRDHFEIDRRYVTVAALHALAEDNKIPSSKVVEAISTYGIDGDKPNPVTL